MIKLLDKHLEGKTHLVDNRRTIADAYAFEHLREDAGVQRAMEQQGIY